MHTFLDNSQQGGKYSAHIAIQQAELIIEKNHWSKLLSISDLQIDYLNLENSVRYNERECFAQSMFSHCESSLPTDKFSKQQWKVKGYK